MNLENFLSVPANSFQERMVKPGDINIAEAFDHCSSVVNDTGYLVTKKGWDTWHPTCKNNLIIHVCF